MTMEPLASSSTWRNSRRQTKPNRIGIHDGNDCCNHDITFMGRVSSSSLRRDKYSYQQRNARQCRPSSSSAGVGHCASSMDDLLTVRRNNNTMRNYSAPPSFTASAFTSSAFTPHQFHDIETTGTTTNTLSVGEDHEEPMDSYYYNDDSIRRTNRMSLGTIMVTCMGVALTFATVQSTTGLNALWNRDHHHHHQTASHGNDNVLDQLSQLKQRQQQHRHLQQTQPQAPVNAVDAIKNLLEKDSDLDESPQWSFHYLLESSIVSDSAEKLYDDDDEGEDVEDGAASTSSNSVAESMIEIPSSSSEHHYHLTHLEVGGQNLDIDSSKADIVSRVEARFEERKEVRNMARAQALARAEAEQSAITANLEKQQTSTQTQPSETFEAQQAQAQVIQNENDVPPASAAGTPATTTTPVATSDGTTAATKAFGDDHGMTAVSIGERAPQATEEDGFSSDPRIVFQHLKPLEDIPTGPLEQVGDVLFFWHVPKAAGSTVKNMLDHCYHKVRPKKVRDPPSTELIQIGKYPPYVNIETHLVPDIKLAKELHLLDSDLPENDGKPVYTQAIVASRLWEASQLFSSNHKGRLVTILRHPVERAISMYRYLGKATWEPTYQSVLKDMTLMEYATKYELKDNNWLVRMLTHTARGPLTVEHVHAATEFLRKFCLIGFMDPDDKNVFASSIKRFEHYFHFETTQESQHCVDMYIHGPGVNVNTASATTVKKEKPAEFQEGSPEWVALEQHNQWDMMLWRNALEIYKEQGQLYGLS